MTTAKKFDPAKRKKLNNPLRLQWLPPQRIAVLAGLDKGGEYMDIGAGTGYISRAVAALYPQATIHALDIEPLMIEEMQLYPDIVNILPQHMKRDCLPFADCSMTGAWSVTVFHELGKAAPLLQETRRVLQPGGHLLIIDWEKKQEACKQGPPLEHRVTAEQVIAELKEAGFSEALETTGFTHHFAVSAKR